MSTAPINPTPPAVQPAAANSVSGPTPGAGPLDSVLSQAQKPGYATTEFWMCALAQVSSMGLVIGMQFFHWNDQQAEGWTRVTGEMAPLVAMLVSFLVTRQYVNQRGDYKNLLAAALSG